MRAAAAADPRGFLDLHRAPAIFDEIQNAPNLLPYIKEKIDERRSQHGAYFLTGSQNLALVQSITESLAGRAAMLRLLPLAHSELLRKKAASLPWETPGPRIRPGHSSRRELWKYFVRGGYPELASQPRRDPYLWHASYVQTYLERDVRSLRQVGDLASFQSFGP